MAPEETDRELVRRARRGDMDAFNDLVVRHQDKIFNAVFRFCGNHEDAADITQRAFINAYRKISEFEGDSAFTTWMYRIAFNQSVSYRRENTRHKGLSLHAGKDDEMVVEPAIVTNPDERMETQDNQRKVQQALNQLDEGDRRIIILKDLEERSYDDIADILDIPKGTVRSRLHRARLALKEKLKAFVSAR
jgi:RNA polymerase sigma-70 factor (ECF subfamily)